MTLPENVIHNRCSYELTRTIYNKSFLNIGVQNSEYKLTKRTFEIIGCGGCLIVPITVEIRNNFTDGKEVIVSESPSDTIEKIYYYKRNLDVYDALRKNAVIASQKYSYEERLKKC